MSKTFRFKLNTGDLLKHLKDAETDIHKTLNYAARELSINARDFIINKAQKELEGFQRSFFLGENGSNIKWEQVNDNLYVVHLDPSIAYIEEGREPVSMLTDKWLLKNPKISKKGKKYKVIPITLKKGGVDKANTELSNLVNKALKAKGIDMQAIDTDKHGKPKLGVVGKLSIKEPTTRAGKNASLFSMPRSAATAKEIGLPGHGGIFHGQGAVITQRKNEKTGKITKEVAVFRIAHEDQKSEGRWMAPKIEAFNSIEAAFKNAESEWDRILKDIESGKR